MNLNLTLLGQAITFALFVWFTLKFVWPLIMTAIEERQKMVADGLAAAEKGQQQLTEATTRIEAQIAETKAKTHDLIQSAEKRADQIVEEAKSKAKDEGQRIIDAAKSEIEREINQAKDALRQQVADIAIAGAEKLIQARLDTDSDRRLLDDLISEI